MFPSMSCFLV